MEHRIGFIGAGKMVSHIVRGLLKEPGMRESIVVVGRNRQKLERFNQDKNVEITSDYSRLAGCDIVVNGVSADQTAKVFEECREYTGRGTIHVSIAGGVSIADIEMVLPEHKIVRNMPNIAVSAGEGVMVMSGNARLSDEDRKHLDDIFSKTGMVEWVDESLMKYVPSLTGSSPTYAFLMIEAMADKAVSVGFDRQQAYHLAAQALVGAGRLVTETDSHPAVLKDQITTSGGSTIQGVMKLDGLGFRHSIIEAMEAINHANQK